MEKLLILGSFQCTWQVIDYARRKGLHTIVTDKYPPSESIAKKWADEFWMIDTSNVDALERRCKEEKVTAVFCGLSEFNIGIMLELTERLHLPCYMNKEQWKYSKDKRLFKNACLKVGMPTPEEFYEDCLDQIEFPVVVKPVDRSGNEGISFCTDMASLYAAIDFAKEKSISGDIVIERKLTGKEWFAMYAVASGEARLVSLNAMYSEPGYPSRVYVVSSTVTDEFNRFMTEANDKLKDVFKEVGIEDGIVWAQVMLDEDGTFYGIEMGQRMDSNMMFETFKGINGFDMIKYLVDCARGIRHSHFSLPAEQKKPYEKCGCNYMLWTDRPCKIVRVEGLEEFKKYPGMRVDDTWLYQSEEKSSYEAIASITFMTANVDDMCSMIEKLNKNVHVYDEFGNDVVIKFTDLDYLKDVYLIGLEEYV